MNSSEFFKKVNDELKNREKQEILDIVNNLIRKIPKSKYDEVICMLGNDKKLENIESKIEEYKIKFKMIDDLDLYFHATGYEDYDNYYWGDWIWEYSDDDKVGDLIKEATYYAVNLVNHKEYKYAKELLDLIIYTNYQFLDDDGGDFFEISLKELQEECLININVYTICTYAIYATYQSSPKSLRAKNIYDYFKNENFRDVSVEDAFKLGTEILTELDDFFTSWINLLIDKQDDISYRLLKETLVYNNFNNYEKYIKDFAVNHPKIYLDIFDYLVKEERIDEVIRIGNLALSYLDKDLTIRNDILLFMAKYDSSNKEMYIIESFESNSTVANLLRIINNGYYLKYKEKINKIISSNKGNTNSNKSNELNKNYVDKDTYSYLQFFLGNFEEFYNVCLSNKKSLGWSYSFIETAVYLWILVLNNNISSGLFLNVLEDIFSRLKIKDNTLFLDDNYSLIFNKWKDNFELLDKDKYLTWLEEVIDKRITAIVEGNHRKSYYKAAKLVVSLGEVMEANGIVDDKEKFIDNYYQKYSRRTAFRSELKKYSNF